jgi:LVIVD repeat
MKRAKLVAVACLMGLCLVASGALAKDFDPLNDPVPKAVCGHSDHTETGLQGETTMQERFSGDSERAYNCNLELVGQEPEATFDGAYSQDGPAYFGNCAYYGTDNVTSLQKNLGLRVIDASDVEHPKVAMFLTDSAAARAPHETVATSDPTHLLAVGQSNGPDFAVYDVSDCSHPILKGDIQLTGAQGHMGAFAPDGRTYYETQSFRGVGGFLYIVDVSNPSNPKELPPWQYLGDGRPHSLKINPQGFYPGAPEGTRMYAGQPGEFGEPSNNSSFGPDGLVVEDVSDYQNRLPYPQIRIISKLFWDDQGQSESMLPIKINGHRYIVTTNEAGGAGGVTGWAGACARGASPFGYPQIIDLTDEANPKIVARLRLEIDLPANCSALLAETPPDPPGTAPGTNLPAISGTTNYSEERCVFDNATDARVMACSFQNGGLRVFDIHDPLHAREIAYWKPGAPRTKVLPSSGSWAQGVDRTVDKIAGWAKLVINKKGNGNGADLDVQLWTVSDSHGFQVLRFSQDFVAKNKDLFNRERQTESRASEE